MEKEIKETEVVREVVATETPEDTIVNIRKGELDGLMARLAKLREAVDEMKTRQYFLQSPAEKYKLCSGIVTDMSVMHNMIRELNDTNLRQQEIELLESILKSYSELLGISIAR